ncbi:MAG TPA: hypothetical protein DDY91_07840, partial [Planctomycetaceae bacterium]|nr:hypothetical protein [Planctomycetaceae bacterium]
MIPTISRASGRHARLVRRTLSEWISSRRATFSGVSTSRFSRRRTTAGSAGVGSDSWAPATDISPASQNPARQNPTRQTFATMVIRRSGRLRNCCQARCWRQARCRCTARCRHTEGQPSRMAGRRGLALMALRGAGETQETTLPDYSDPRSRVPVPGGEQSSWRGRFRRAQFEDGPTMIPRRCTNLFPGSWQACTMSPSPLPPASPDRRAFLKALGVGGGVAGLPAAVLADERPSSLTI